MSNEVGRGFVFVVVFIFTFPFLLSMIPSEFVGVIDEDELSYYEDVPTGTWVGDQIAGWSEEFLYYNNVTIAKNFYEYDFKVGDHDFGVMWEDDDTKGDPINFEHEFKWTIFTWYHALSESPYSYSDNIENLEYTSDPQTSRVVMTCDNVLHAYTWYISITYNATKFSSMAEAYNGTVTDAPELRVFVGLGWESDIGSGNAWNVISHLLTFRLPNVHPLLNGLIGFSLWACIIYLAFVLIRSIIPLLGGG